VHERQVAGGGKRVRVLDRHRRLGRHPGMSDRLVTGHRTDPVALAHLSRRSDVFIHFDRRAEAE
jgi:hypothetical protein